MIAYKPLLKFMTERHKIYLARSTGCAAPWTNDEILQTYKFTNVYRELDRVTVWVRKNIREPYADHPNLWFMLCIARQINWPPTLGALMNTPLAWPYSNAWDWKKTMSEMRRIARNGEKLYTSAYLLAANAANKLGKEKGAFDKPEVTCKLTLRELWNDRIAVEPRLHGTMQDAWSALSVGHHGWGGFTSYEVVCDLRYTRYLRNAPDVRTWAHAGPGAKRGLNRLLGKGAKERPFLSDAAAVEAMQWLLWKIGPEWPHLPKLEMREIEHSLCEFDKYERARLGEGRPRSFFRPSEEPL